MLSKPCGPGQTLAGVVNGDGHDDKANAADDQGQADLCCSSALPPAAVVLGRPPPLPETEHLTAPTRGQAGDGTRPPGGRARPPTFMSSRLAGRAPGLPVNEVLF